MGIPISDINFTTTKISMYRSGFPIGSATGFFFRDEGKEYLATNRHVVIDERRGIFPDTLTITLHKSRQDLTQNWGVDVRLCDGGEKLWHGHPDYPANMCDVVLIPLSGATLIGEAHSRFTASPITCIGSEIINTKEVYPFGDVVIIGYPLGFYDEVHNLPVYRRAMMASCYGVDFDGLPYFLVDARLHPGTSGSPVVNSHHTLFREQGFGEDYVLFGVHSAEHLVGEEPLGLNVVWYAHLLLDISRKANNEGS